MITKGMRGDPFLLFLDHLPIPYSIRLGLTRAKALQAARRFPRETRRRFAVPKSNAFTLERGRFMKHLN